MKFHNTEALRDHLLKTYDRVSKSFEGGYGWVEKGDKAGIVNTRGEIIIPLEYDCIGIYRRHKLIAVKKDGKWGMFNTDGRMVEPIAYNDITSNNDDYPIVRNV
jgi:hypothetical protein